jgi:hypothetical protein
MIQLKESFRLNPLYYKLLKRNEFAALFGLSSNEGDEIISYEVCEIYIEHYGNDSFETVPNNLQFEKDSSKCFNNYGAALLYFELLSDKLKLFNTLAKIIPGVGQNGSGVFGYQVIN